MESRLAVLRGRRALVLERHDVSRRVAQAALRRVTVFAAPAGFGKSAAIDAHLRTAEGHALRFNVGRSDTSLARFVRSLAAAFEAALPHVGQTLAIAHERATQSPSPAGVLAAWLAQHLDEQPRTIVIDDLHHCDGNRGIVELIENAIERTGPDVRWILAVRSVHTLPLARWLARGDATLPIDAEALRLTSEEALALGARFAPMLSAATVLAVRDVTGGAVAACTFALRTLALDPGNLDALVATGGDPFERFADMVFARLLPLERTRLIDSVALPDLDRALLANTPEHGSWLESIEERAPHIFRLQDGRKQYTDAFYRYLRARLEERGPSAMRAATVRAAAVLERVGRIDETLALYIRERNDGGLVRIVDAHGFAFLESGYGESIHDAIAALDPKVAATSATVLAIKAVWESSGGRFDTAEALFGLAMDRASEPLRAQIVYQYGTHLSRFARPEAIDVFEELSSGAAVSETLRVYALAALGPAYVSERRLGDARRVSAEALELALAAGTAHLIAKTHYQAAHVALSAGDAERAKRLASVALDLAKERGFFDIAAGVLSVMYGVAADIEDDPVESLRLLEAVGDCAAKSGSLTNHLSALVAALEIEVERSNEVGAARIDSQLRALDVSLAGRAIYEALLPVQALRATWTGDFAGAYRLLEHSATAHWKVERKALRLAEIALYAAAAGFERETHMAIHTALDVLATVAQVEPRVQRARLLLALAASVAGSFEIAAHVLAEVDAAPQALSRRLGALRNVVGALHERYGGLRNHDRLFARLAELQTCGFAGIARMIAMLPPVAVVERAAPAIVRAAGSRRDATSRDAIERERLR